MTAVSQHEIIQVGGVDVTPAMMEMYKHTARTSAAQRQRRLATRQMQALAVAQRAADMLRTDFGATQVVLIGSLTGATTFHDRSDVDLVVYGIRQEDYWRAVAQLLSLDPTIEIDLIEAANAASWVEEAVAREGVAL